MGIHNDLGKRTLIMGILNVTPDSFSDGGRYATVQQAVAHAKRLVAEGADLIDIGGESTRPGHTPITAEEELARIIPVIEAVKSAGIGAGISVDTYKGAVAEEALKAGAAIVNDIWAGQKDPYILEVAAKYKAPIILTHNRNDMNYGADFVADVIQDMRTYIRSAKEAGVPEENIILDPGIGFAKTRQQELILMGRMDELAALGYPVLLGTSRKRFLRDVLGGGPEDVLEGTIATTVLGIQRGVSIVRVHDVEANAKAARMTDAVVAAAAGQAVR